MTGVDNLLEFEEPVMALESKLEELRHLDDGEGVNIIEEIARLQGKIERQLKSIYAKLTPWQKVQVARHPQRPHFLDYMSSIADDFVVLGGDRSFADDKAILGGIGSLQGRSCVFIGMEKGKTVNTRLKHNFGMARPEGYRKAIRLMRMAEQFFLPVVTLIDTPGAYPGVGAEERGQAEAIARAVSTGLEIRTPFIAVIIGEGGSGGAIALASADRVLMLSNAVYSLISPEGCATILWRDTSRAIQAAESLRLTAQDLIALQIVDRIVEEPLGGAHRKPDAMAESLKRALVEELEKLDGNEGHELVARRHEKYLTIGEAAHL